MAALAAPPPFPVRISQQVADVLADRPRVRLYPDRVLGPLLLPEHIASAVDGAIAAAAAVPDGGEEREQESEPVCCGEPMGVAEYDSDEDSYLYVCTENREHSRWVTDDDEVWK